MITGIIASRSEDYQKNCELKTVPQAYSKGYDTAETGVQMSSKVVGVGLASSGTDNDGKLWPN
jgi:hypothetical protein